ncbi:hypothetical protein [Methylomonas koyamae]|uniref:hypothetical protein n=1 Tax=Methylomonas koyamae TaxID=702114 RepID=UPI0012F6B50E|nr:hypothetical protein [Methylomonas koyamae]
MRNTAACWLENKDCCRISIAKAAAEISTHDQQQMLIKQQPINSLLAKCLISSGYGLARLLQNIRQVFLIRRPNAVCSKPLRLPLRGCRWRRYILIAEFNV